MSYCVTYQWKDEPVEHQMFDDLEIVRMRLEELEVWVKLFGKEYAIGPTVAQHD